MEVSTSSKLEFVTLDVFMNTRYLGKPLAVVFVPAHQRAHLTQDRRQSTTREFNLSETVFLHVPVSKDDEVLVLKHLQWNHVKTLLTKAGPISITSLGGSVKAEIPHAVHVHKNSLASLSSNKSHLCEPSLNEKASIREAEKSGRIVSIVRGMTFVMIKLDSPEDLAPINRESTRTGLRQGARSAG